MRKTILGIHHITAICSDAQANLDFYSGVLGLRLVKRTVNFDDPGTYHLYYGDALGHPGTILTFFAWPGAQQGRIGSGQVTATSLAIPPDSIDHWMNRLQKYGIPFQGPTARFGDQVVTFSDPDGMIVELITSSGLKHGFHSATLAEANYQSAAAILTKDFGFRLLGQEGNRYRYTLDSSEPGTIVDILDEPKVARGHVAAGTVHHIAWRTPSDEEQSNWLTALTAQGASPSPIMDRVYFHSIYFREPGGILFEIATDPPGFTLDEAADQLGSSIKLPPWLEASRILIEQTLPKLEIA